MWQPIETAPRDGRQLLAIDADSQMVVAEWRVLPDGTCFWEIGHSRVPGHYWRLGNQLTHWQPLPPPPTTRAEGAG
jgi:hypothetical protein